jgi:hypothetical protein
MKGLIFMNTCPNLQFGLDPCHLFLAMTSISNKHFVDAMSRRKTFTPYVRIVEPLPQHTSSYTSEQLRLLRVDFPLPMVFCAQCAQTFAGRYLKHSRVFPAPPTFINYLEQHYPDVWKKFTCHFNHPGQPMANFYLHFVTQVNRNLVDETGCCCCDLCRLPLSAFVNVTKESFSFWLHADLPENLLSTESTEMLNFFRWGLKHHLSYACLNSDSDMALLQEQLRQRIKRYIQALPLRSILTVDWLNFLPRERQQELLHYKSETCQGFERAIACLQYLLTPSMTNTAQLTSDNWAVELHESLYSLILQARKDLTFDHPQTITSPFPVSPFRQNLLPDFATMMTFFPGKRLCRPFCLNSHSHQFFYKDNSAQTKTRIEQPFDSCHYYKFHQLILSVDLQDISILAVVHYFRPNAQFPAEIVLSFPWNRTASNAPRTFAQFLKTVYHQLRWYLELGSDQIWEFSFHDQTSLEKHFTIFGKTFEFCQYIFWREFLFWHQMVALEPRALSPRFKCELFAREKTPYGSYSGRTRKLSFSTQTPNLLLYLSQQSADSSHLDQCLYNQSKVPIRIPVGTEGLS